MVLRLHKKRRPVPAAKKAPITKADVKAEIRAQKKIFRESTRLFEATYHLLQLIKNPKNPVHGNRTELIRRLEKEIEKIKQESSAAAAQLKLLSERLQALRDPLI